MMAARRDILGDKKRAFRFAKRPLLSVCLSKYSGVVQLPAFSIILLLLIASGPVGANSVKRFSFDQEDSMDALVQKLGNDEYQIRQQTEQQLRKIGGPAIAALKRARMAGDSEIRFRARRLLIKIVREDYQRRLADFLESEDPSNEFGLNGWLEFSEIIGTDAYARRLFVGMQNTSIDMFLAWSANETDFRRTVVKVVSFEEHSSPQAHHINAMAAAMFGHIRMNDQALKSERARQNNPISTRRSNRIVSPEAVAKIARRLNQYEIMKLIETSGYQDCMKRLLTRWLQLVPDRSDDLLLKLKLVKNYNLEQFLSSALIALKSETVKNDDLATAISIIANAKDSNQIEQLEPLIENTETCFTFRDFHNPDKSHRVQIRDVALAAMVFLSDQPYEKFGFKAKTNKTDKTFVSLQKCWLASEQERANAIEKWRTFRNSPKSEHLE